MGDWWCSAWSSEASSGLGGGGWGRPLEVSVRFKGAPLGCLVWFWDPGIVPKRFPLELRFNSCKQLEICSNWWAFVEIWGLTWLTESVAGRLPGGFASGKRGRSLLHSCSVGGRSPCWENRAERRPFNRPVGFDRCLVYRCHRQTRHSFIYNVLYHFHSFSVFRLLQPAGRWAVESPLTWRSSSSIGTMGRYGSLPSLPKSA